MSYTKTVSCDIYMEKCRKKYHISASKAYQLGLKSLIDEAEGRGSENKQALQQQIENLKKAVAILQEQVDLYRRLRGEKQ